DRDLVRVPGEQRHLVADADAGNNRVDRSELAADAVRGVRLQVERVLLGRAAPEEDEDAVVGGGAGRGGGPGLEKRQQRGPRGPELPQSDHRVAAVEHGDSPGPTRCNGWAFAVSG